MGLTISGEESRFPCQCIGLRDDEEGERLNELLL